MWYAATPKVMFVLWYLLETESCILWFQEWVCCCINDICSVVVIISSSSDSTGQSGLQLHVITNMLHYVCFLSSCKENYLLIRIITAEKLNQVRFLYPLPLCIIHRQQWTCVLRPAATAVIVCMEIITWITQNGGFVGYCGGQRRNCMFECPLSPTINTNANKLRHCWSFYWLQKYHSIIMVGFLLHVRDGIMVQLWK